MSTPRNGRLEQGEHRLTHRLITITFSHYCEKARWALDLRGVPFVEDGHLPFFSRRATRPVGGTSTPALVVDDGRRVLPDSTDILRFADEVGTRGGPLFPGDDVDVAALEARFDDDLGPHARRAAYFEILQSDATLRALVDHAQVPGWEKTVGKPSLPLFKFLLRRGLKIDAAGVERSTVKINAVFADVEARLRDGRPYLCGDRFTAADLTFASLAAPLVLPEGYLTFLVPWAACPPGIRAFAERWRATPAGAFAMAQYAKHRAA